MAFLVDRVRNRGPNRRTAPGGVAGGRRFGSRGLLRAGGESNAAGGPAQVRSEPRRGVRQGHATRRRRGRSISYFPKRGLTCPLIPQIIENPRTSKVIEEE